MFDYGTLMSRRRLEAFLDSEPKEVKINSEEKTHKGNFIRKTINYFTGKSGAGYTYKINDNGNDVEYNYPRTFLGDVRNLRNYLADLSSQDE